MDKSDNSIKNYGIMTGPVTSGKKNRVVESISNYNIKIKIVIFVAIFVVIVFLGLFLKWVLELLPASLF